MSPIPFTRGVPSADMLPVDELREAAERALLEDGGRALSYAPGGYPPLREWIAGRHGVDPSRVLMTNGSLQGVAFLAQHLFLGRGGLVVTEDPTYDRTLLIVGSFGAQITSVPVTADGIDPDELDRTLAAHAGARLLYLIPTFQNPSGVSLGAEARVRVVELARKHGVLLMEDDPYGLLRFEGDRLSTLHELDGGDNVIYSSSFTKTVAPGIRTGYMVLPERLVKDLMKLSENTLISPNTFAEATLHAYCRAGRFEPGVERATAILKERRDAMEDALRAHFPDGARWIVPQGGYFYWIDLPGDMDTAALLPEAAERGVPYVSGRDFSPDRGRASVRLAFSAVPPSEIAEGVARLGALFAEKLAPAQV